MITYNKFVEAIRYDLNIDVKYEGNYDKAKIDIRWRVGGQTGGSCYGGANRGITADAEPEFESLTQILTHFSPNLSFIKFNELQKKIVKFEDGLPGDKEYYGNYSIYAEKSVVLKDLHTFLADNMALPAIRPPKPGDEDDE